MSTVGETVLRFVGAIVGNREGLAVGAELAVRDGSVVGTKEGSFVGV